MSDLDTVISKRISQYDKILIVLCAIYPIVPAYFKIARFSFPYICYILLLLCSLFFYNLNQYFRVNLLTIILLLWMIINVLLCFYHSYYYGAVWVILLVMAGLTLGNCLKRKNVFIRVIIGVCYASGIVCIFGLIEAITGFNIWTIFNNSDAVININPPRFGITRIVAFAYQTISYGTFLVLIACLLMYLLSIKKIVSFRQRFFLKLIYCLVVLNIVLTLSRSVILIYIVSQIMILYGLGAKKLLTIILKIMVIGIIGLFFLSFIAPEIFHSIRNVYYMILAVFDKGYTELIAGEFGKDNLNAVGTRLDIYKWVYEKVGNHVWLGVGFKTPFSYEYDSGNIWHTMVTKSAIEVEYMLAFYETGYVGLVSEIIVFLTIVVVSIKKRFTPSYWEGKISFNYIMFVIMTCLMVQYFMVNQSSEQYLFFLIVALFLAYNNHSKFNENGVNI